MKIDKLVYTESEKQEIQELETALFQTYSSGMSSTGLFDTEQSKRLSEIRERAELRYIRSFFGNKAAVLDDVREILDATTKEEFEQEQDKRQKTIPSFDLEEVSELYDFKSEKSREEAKKALNNSRQTALALSEKNAANFYTFLTDRLFLQYRAIIYRQPGTYNGHLLTKEESEITMQYAKIVKKYGGFGAAEQADTTAEEKKIISAFNVLMSIPVEERILKMLPSDEKEILHAFKKMIAAKVESYYPQTKGESAPQPPKISTSKLLNIAYPLDKVNAELWNCFSIGENTPLKAESDEDSRKGKRANIYAMLDFDELDGVKISRPLTSTDKRIFIAISNLREAGHETMTISQIHAAMGGTSRPDETTRTKIRESIETMRCAEVSIDTTEEHELYPRYDRIVWESQLMHIEKTKGYLRGQIADYTIRVVETPKLYLFAKQRYQITSVPLELFKSPINKTEANLRLEDYIISRIAGMKNNTKKSRTILIDKIYQKCNITTKEQRQRLPEKIERYLKHYVSVGWIKAYKLTDKSIKIVTYKKSV